MLLMTKLRKAKELSQSALSRESNLHVSTVNAIESGRLSPWPGQRIKIAQALGHPVEDADALFEEADA